MAGDALFFTGFHIYIPNKYRTEGAIFLKKMPRKVGFEKLVLNPYV
jgi:hypothetical protein